MKDSKVMYLLEKLSMGFTNLSKDYKKDDFVDIDYLKLLLKDLEELTNYYRNSLK